MWVDMFLTDYGWVPSPVNIELRKPEEYELRVIVWNTADIELLDGTYFTGKKLYGLRVVVWNTADVELLDDTYFTGEKWAGILICGEIQFFFFRTFRFNFLF
uniref:Otoferlin n=1 Tax=Cacopsylla melanoneura TaxID=428564 RepID=A0A8D8W3V1_9HEMI